MGFPTLRIYARWGLSDMAIVFPNRVVDTGTYSLSAGTVTLSSQTAAGYRTVASAVADSALSDGDIVGVALVDKSDQTKWVVWKATYSTGVLTMITQEDVSATALADAATVSVTLCQTSLTIAEYIDAILNPLTYGPDYWEAGTTDTEWNAADSVWQQPSGSDSSGWLNLEPVGTWIAGVRPTTITFEMWAPTDLFIDYADFVVEYNSGSSSVNHYMGGEGDYTLDAWNTVTVDTSSVNSDITTIRFGAGSITGTGLKIKDIALNEA